ncbi:Quinol monooxygenase YgiN [Flavobacterium sp. CF108]|uniref:putative quinol monooxygenase n=1 Tax=unclassified Flavobacterium TaxID=196869 RepID=UPI0008D84B0F|nr:MULTISPECIES: antibiotic biosynthesis monooxygenase [unclassified Flavobacterium]SEO22088.1 Quinol monooxygenase YgiN [Flavobacterium sp. fv08]SHG50954.1 Quinol monooxygenase YgiN [Flavobacterium sp. CF108]
MKKKIITNAALKINPEFIEEVLPIAIETKAHILLEEGCENFVLMRKTEEPNTIVIFAIYTSKETYDWHLEQDYVKRFLAFLNGKLDAPPEVTYLEEM